MACSRVLVLLSAAGYLLLQAAAKDSPAEDMDLYQLKPERVIRCRVDEHLSLHIENATLTTDPDDVGILRVSGNYVVEMPMPLDTVMQLTLYKCMTRDYEDCTNRYYFFNITNGCDMLMHSAPHSTFLVRFFESIENFAPYCNVGPGIYWVNNAPMEAQEFLRAFPFVGIGSYKLCGEYFFNGAIRFCMCAFAEVKRRPRLRKIKEKHSLALERH